MIKSRTARLRATNTVKESPEGRRATRLSLVAAATTLAAIGFVGMADLAAADPGPSGPGTIVVAPHTDPEPDPGPILIPAPQPQPPAPGEVITADIPEPQPDPPAPEPQFPISDDQGGDPEPEPQPEPEVNPDLDPIDDVLTSDEGCTITHGACPGEDEEPTPDGHCFDDAGEVIDPSECIPTDEDTPDTKQDDPADEPETEVEGSTQDRGSLPRTGAGIAVLGALGTALVAAGAAAKRVARS